MHKEGDDRGESVRRLLEADAELIFGVLAVVGTSLRAGDSGVLTKKIRSRLSQDGAISSPDSLGEAAVVVERLCQQMLYVLGAYGDERPEAGPMPTLSVHSLALPDRDRAAACLADIAPLGPARTRIVDSRDNDPRHAVELDVAFPGLPPDPEWAERQNQLDAIVRRHGGNWAAASGSWW
ncbi:MAG: hypothetical protein U0R68_18220 [Candidatus Nanopelagicales bacterium]